MNSHVTLDHCVACESQSVRLKHKGNYTESVAQASRYFLSGREATAHGDIWACSACGFEFTSPQFAPGDYAGIYANAKLAPKGIDLGPSHRKRFERIAQWIAIDIASVQAHLDFGCGDGQLLQVVNSASPVGFDVVEPRFAWDRARYVYGSLSGRIIDGSLNKGSFDLVTAIDVLEHLPALDEHFDCLKQLLAPKAHLVISVPDATTLTAKLMGQKWPMYLLEHLWYFTPDSLSKFAARHGLVLGRSANVPYYTPVAHLLNRLLQTGSSGSFGDIQVRVPAGIRIFQLTKQ
jgi:SAM-dependent methyltransferase